MLMFVLQRLRWDCYGELTRGIGFKSCCYSLTFLIYEKCGEVAHVEIFYLLKEKKLDVR